MTDTTREAVLKQFFDWLERKSWREINMIDTTNPRRTAMSSCTCHPDDNPPVPCPQKYALTDCRLAAADARIRELEADGWISAETPPDDSEEDVLVHLANGEYTIARFIGKDCSRSLGINGETGWFDAEMRKQDGHFLPTHWKRIYPPKSYGGTAAADKERNDR